MNALVTHWRDLTKRKRSHRSDGRVIDVFSFWCGRLVRSPIHSEFTQVSIVLLSIQLCTVCLGASHGDELRQLVTPSWYSGFQFSSFEKNPETWEISHLIPEKNPGFSYVHCYTTVPKSNNNCIKFALILFHKMTAYKNCIYRFVS